MSGDQLSYTTGKPSTDSVPSIRDMLSAVQQLQRQMDDLDERERVLLAQSACPVCGLKIVAMHGAPRAWRACSHWYAVLKRCVPAADAGMWWERIGLWPSYVPLGVAIKLFDDCPAWQVEDRAVRPTVSEMLGASECPKRLRQCARHDWRYVGVVPYGTATMNSSCQCRMENLWEIRDRGMVTAPNVDIVCLVLYTFIVNRERVCILFGQCDTCGAVYYARQEVRGCGACWPATTDEMGVWDE